MASIYPQTIQRLNNHVSPVPPTHALSIPRQNPELVRGTHGALTQRTALPAQGH